MNQHDRLVLFLQKRLRPSRLEHCLSMEKEATRLAVRFHADVERAALAGLVHDCAKDLPAKDMLEAAKRYQIEVDGLQRRIPALLHGQVGAQMLRYEAGITDELVLGAVRVHTGGSPDLSRLDAVVCLADFVEPLRDYPGVQRMRRAAMERPLEEALALCLGDNLRFLLKKGGVVHPCSLHTYNALCILLEDGEELK